MALEVIRKIMARSADEQVAKITVTVEEDVATYLNNKKRRELAKIEDENRVQVLVLGGEGLAPEYLKIDSHDASGREVRSAHD
jgi:ribonuclease E